MLFLNARGAFTPVAAFKMFFHQLISRNQKELSPERSIEFIMQKSSEGDFVNLDLSPSRQTFLLGNPEDIQHVLMKKPLNFHKSGFVEKFKRYFGNGIFSSEAKEHRHQRRSLQGHMTRSSITSLTQQMWQDIETISSEWKHGQEINLINELVSIGALTMAKFVFDISNKDEALKIHSLGIRCHRSFCEREDKPFKLKSFIPTRINLRYERDNKKIETEIADILKKARNLIKSQELSKESIISLLLQAKDDAGNALDDKQIIEQLKTFLMVTADPIRTVAWTIYEAFKDKNIHNKIIKEVSSPLTNNKADKDIVKNLSYVAKAYSETIRKYPHSWIFHRRTLEPLQLPSGNTLPKGSDVFISPLVMHRNERYFPEPNKFDPERFAEKNSATWPKGAYLPFGLGPRSCIGEPYARQQAVITIAYLFKHFEFEFSEAPKFNSPNFFTIQPTAHQLNTKVVKLHEQ